MKLTKLSLYNFRNLTELSFDCSEGINCLVGKNGVGKTNILDAIYYLSFCKSNLISNDGLNVRHGESSFALQGIYDDEDVKMQVSCMYNLNDKNKVIKCNDKKYTKLADHIGLIPLVFVSPDDMSLILDGSAERRKFLDTFISTYDRDYLTNLISYNKILAQRNALLKQENGFDETYVSILDEKLARFGTLIFNVRKNATAILSERTKHFYSQISSKEECSITYESQLFSGDMLFQLDKNYDRDKFLTYTSVGVHRDDLSFCFNGEAIKNVASQGQKKSFLLALKFAQYQLLKEYKNGKNPLLLLDDLFDKLDKERTKKIFDVVAQQEFGQIFITDTDKLLLHNVFAERNSSIAFWNIEDGEIKRISE